MTGRGGRQADGREARLGGWMMNGWMSGWSDGSMANHREPGEQPASRREQAGKFMQATHAFSYAVSLISSLPSSCSRSVWFVRFFVLVCGGGIVRGRGCERACRIFSFRGLPVVLMYVGFRPLWLVCLSLRLSACLSCLDLVVGCRQAGRGQMGQADVQMERRAGR